jgi:hypothetical protein
MWQGNEDIQPDKYMYTQKKSSKAVKLHRLLSKDKSDSK